MEPFLDKLAKHLFATHGENFSRICLVFPSRRAGMFFKQYVSRIIDKPIWLPEIYALEDFVVMKSGLTLCDPLELTARLYKVYKKLEKEKAQSFSDFISWGNMLLGDFDEIDQYLADGEKVFSYLDEIKAMKSWNPDGKPLTTFEQDYLRFYNSLAPCYKLFRDGLVASGQGYFGLAFDELLKQIKTKSFDEWDRIVFAGFNALTAAEEKLFKHLLEAGKAEIYWDADNYYLQDPRQEAGRFMREYFRENTFGKLNWVGDALRTGTKKVSVIGVPGNVGQAKLASAIIDDLIAKKGTSDGIALVLVDESLLLPVLNSIPAKSGDFNVTMGFPLKQTPVFSLINIVLNLFANAQRFAQPQPDGNTLARYYYKDIQRFLSHPYIYTTQRNNGNFRVTPDNAAVNRSFYAPADFMALLEGRNKALASLFKPYLEKKYAEASDAISLVREIISFLRNAFSPQEVDGEAKAIPVHSIELEYLFHAAELCSTLDVILKDPEIKPDFETVQSVVSNLIAGKRLPFYGEPLNGLQVMGMLETRLLDFTDIIMISANEGLLPKGKHQTTFIPDEVRTQFGMQRYSERTAVFGYHFYRLMQRVENAWLLYNTEGDELGGGEKSRFISQLMYEMPKVNPGIAITEQTLSVLPGSTDAGTINVQKTPEISARLLQIAERGISPTALATYLKCRLQFYFSQVLRISEPEQVSETIDAATLGEIVHEALQHTYEPFKDREITPDVLATMLPQALRNVNRSFSAKFNTDELSTGKNMLIVKVAENIVKRFLLAEKKYLEQTGTSISILMLEEELHSIIEINGPANGERIQVKIHGKADRIDRVGGVVRIIDYKTGKVDLRDLKTDSLSGLSEKDEPAKLLQVLAYALMYSDMQAMPPGQLISGIVSLRKSSEYLIKTDIGKSNMIDKDMLASFREELTAIISGIFDVSVPFSQTDDRETCALCTFSAICNRAVN